MIFINRIRPFWQAGKSSIYSSFWTTRKMKICITATILKWNYISIYGMAAKKGWRSSFPQTGQRRKKGKWQAPRCAMQKTFLSAQPSKRVCWVQSPAEWILKKPISLSIFTYRNANSFPELRQYMPCSIPCWWISAAGPENPVSRRVSPQKSMSAWIIFAATPMSPSAWRM